MDQIQTEEFLRHGKDVGAQPTTMNMVKDFGNLELDCLKNYSFKTNSIKKMGGGSRSDLGNGFKEEIAEKVMGKKNYAEGMKNKDGYENLGSSGLGQSDFFSGDVEQEDFMTPARDNQDKNKQFFND